MGLPSVLAAMAHTRLESRPPESKKPTGGVGVQPLVHAGHQLLPDVFQNFRHIVVGVGRGVGDCRSTARTGRCSSSCRWGRDRSSCTGPPGSWPPRRRRCSPIRCSRRREGRMPMGSRAGDEQLLAAVVEDHGELGVQMLEHVQAVLIVEGQDDLAVGVRLEGIPFRFQLLLHGAEAVQLAVADHAVGPPEEGLHALRRQAHDGPAARSPEDRTRSSQTRWSSGPREVVRSRYSVKVSLGRSCPGITHDTAHFDDTPYISYSRIPRAAPNKKRQPARPLYRTSCCLETRGATYLTAAGTPGVRSLFRTRSPLKRCRCNARPAAPLLPASRGSVCSSRVFFPAPSPSRLAAECRALCADVGRYFSRSTLLTAKA